MEQKRFRWIFHVCSSLSGDSLLGELASRDSQVWNMTQRGARTRCSQRQRRRSGAPVLSGAHLELGAHGAAVGKAPSSSLPSLSAQFRLSFNNSNKKMCHISPLSCVAVKAELRPNLFAVTTLAMAARRFRFLICAAFLLRSEPSLESRTCQLLSRALSFFFFNCLWGTRRGGVSV